MYCKRLVCVRNDIVRAYAPNGGGWINLLPAIHASYEEGRRIYVGMRLEVLDDSDENHLFVRSGVDEPDGYLLRNEAKGFDDESSKRLRLETFVRQRAVLSHPAVKLSLTHGGQSSANEGIAAALPLVCMPLFCDQYEVAEAVQRHGLGLVFHKDELAAGNVAQISQVILRAAEENCFRRTAHRYAHLMRLRKGCGRAGEVLESIVWAGADYQELWCGQCSAPVEDRSPGVAAGGGA